MENNIKRTTINGVMMTDLEVAQAYIQNLEEIIADRDVTIEGLKKDRHFYKYGYQEWHDLAIALNDRVIDQKAEIDSLNRQIQEGV